MSNLPQRDLIIPRPSILPFPANSSEEELVNRVNKLYSSLADCQEKLSLLRASVRNADLNPAVINRRHLTVELVNVAHNMFDLVGAIMHTLADLR